MRGGVWGGAGYPLGMGTRPLQNSFPVQRRRSPPNLLHSLEYYPNWRAATALFTSVSGALMLSSWRATSGVVLLRLIRLATIALTSGAENEVPDQRTQPLGLNVSA